MKLTTHVVWPSQMMSSPSNEATEICNDYKSPVIISSNPHILTGVHHSNIFRTLYSYSYHILLIAFCKCFYLSKQMFIIQMLKINSQRLRNKNILIIPSARLLPLFLFNNPGIRIVSSLVSFSSFEPRHELVLICLS